MNIVYLNLIFVTFFITNSYETPQIFRETDTCEIPVHDKKHIKFHTVPAELNAQNDDFRVRISLCNKDSYVPKNLAISSTISVYNKKLKFSVNDTNARKPYEATNEKEGILIILQNEIKCNEQENYYVSIKIGRTNSKKPRLNSESDCSIEIEVTSSDHSPTCTHHLEGKWFVDLNPLRNHPITLYNKEGEKYVISLCGPVRDCRREVGCKISSNKTTIIGSNKELDVKFSDSVIVSSKTSKPNRKTMSVTLKCDWKVPYFSNPKLLNEGTNHKFEVFSSFGCVKKPSNCLLSNDHLSFNLNGLTTNNGVAVGGTSRNFKLSLCGDLNINWKGNERNWLKSQVCEIDGSNYINRGSIPHFSINDNSVTVLLTDGDKCNEKSTYSTTINFKCSTTDTGPVFIAQDECSVTLSWNTPKACPKYRITKKSCELSSVYGKLNITELHKNTDYTFEITRDQKIIYNICGKTRNNCSASEEVSVCLVERNGQKVVGWNEPTVSFVDGEVKLEYKGEKCGIRNKPYTFTMNLVCSFEEKTEINPLISKVDECTFVSKISTRSACLKTWEIKDCVLERENFKYDLSSLIRKSESYRIRDEGNRDVSYLMNLCAPVIPEKGNLFFSGSMVYMVNASEPSIVNKFVDIGSVANPTLENGDLVIEAKMGKQCNSPTGITSYSSRIIFECSDTEDLPLLLENKGCQMDFKWRTKHACPIMKTGGSCSIKAGDRSIQVPGDPMEVKLDAENSYYFSLCLDHYKWCRMGRCVVKKLYKSDRIQEETLYSQYNLTDSNVLQTVDIIVQCDPFKTLGYTKDYRRRDHLNVIVKTRMACRNGGKTIRNTLEGDAKERYEVESKTINDTITDKPNVSEVDETSPLIDKITDDLSKSTASTPGENKTERQHLLCQISDRQGKTIDLYTLETAELKREDGIYILNFDGKSAKCNGLICKNGKDILGYIEKCPRVNYRNNFTVLEYSTSQQCQLDHSAVAVNAVVELTLGCKSDGILTNVEEEDCKVTVSYSSPKICNLASSSKGYVWLVVILVVFIVFLIACFVLFVLYRRDYFKKCSYDSVSEVDLVVHSKML